MSYSVTGEAKEAQHFARVQLRLGVGQSAVSFFIADSLSCAKGMSPHSETNNAAFRKIIGQPEIKRDGSHLMEGWNKRVKRWAEAKNDDLEMLHWGSLQ